MKKLILSAFAGSLLLASCSKEETPTATNPGANVNKPIMQVRSIQVVDTYFDNGAVPGVDGVDYGCTGAPKDCGPVVTVTQGNQTIIDNMWTEITTQGPSHIQSYFNTNATDLATIMDVSIVNAVKNGNATTGYRGTSSATRYLLIKVQGAVYHVIPYL